MKRNSSPRSALLCFCLLHSAFCPGLRAQGTAFTYQGRLNDSGGPANGIYDLRFAIYDSTNNPGAVIAGPLTNSAIAVSNGLFTVTLNFGTGVFDGAERWLEIGVRTNGGGAFTALAPRQELTPAPYAIFAPNAGAAVIAASVATNGVSTPSLQNGAVTGDKIANATILAADVDAASFSNTFWKVNGNAGTTPGTHFLGTIDNRALDFQVNGTRALRLEPNATGGPNVIGGRSANFILANSPDSTIGGGEANQIGSNSPRSLISGGGFNSILTNSQNSIIAGGSQNVIRGNAPSSVIAGGNQNAVGNPQSFIGGGFLNINNGGQSVIGGGGGNTIQTTPFAYNVIAGGFGNTTRTNADRAKIGGGEANTIGAASWATIGGGYGNTNNGNYATLGGGASNTVNTARATVCGGAQNLAGGDSAAIGGGQNNAATNSYATVGGGRNNVASGISATVPGGENNAASGDLSFAAGQNAKARHPGSFVWADSFGSDFVSSADNQFLIRALGGVGIGTANPLHQLTVGVPETPVNTPSLAGLYRGGGAYLTLRDTTSHAEALVGADSTAIVAAMTDHALTFRAGNGAGFGNVEYMRIARGGNVGIGTANPTNKLHVAGGVSATAFVSTSDRNAKENFAPVSPREVLARVAALPITTWNFKDLHDGRHMGPMAQDFHAAFGLGGSDTTITSVDPDGVALAAIQGLNQRLTEELKRRDAENAELKRRLDSLEAILAHQKSN